MAKTRKTRRTLRRAASGPLTAQRPPGTLTVQLLPHLIAAGELPRADVGDVLEIVPAVYAGVLHNAGPFHGALAPSHWSVDEFGCLDSRGTVTAVPLDPASGCTCRIDVLDAAGWLVPVNWAGTEPPEGDGPLHVEGSLYLDPMLDAGSGHGEAVALCRRRFRVTAVRRYRRTECRPLGPVSLRGFPVPAQASDDAVYVADLSVERETGPTAAPESGDREGSGS